MADQILGNYPHILNSAIADPTLVNIPIINFNEPSPALQNKTMVPAQFALLIGALTANAAAGSGANDFTASRYLYTAGFNFQVGGTFNNSIFQVNGTSGAVSFISTITLGNVVAGTTGQINLNGSISGTVSIIPNSTAGTWTFKLPNSGGTNLWFLQTDGSGNTTWAAATTTSLPLSSITASTIATSIDNLNFNETWAWSTLSTQVAHTLTANAITTGTILSISSTSQLASGSTQTGLKISLIPSGGTTTATNTSVFGLDILNSNTGATSGHRAARFSVNGGTQYKSMAADFIGAEGAGWVLGSSDSSTAHIWNRAVTADITNWVMKSTTTAMSINSTNGVNVAIGGTTIAIYNSTGLTLTGSGSPITGARLAVNYAADASSANYGVVSIGGSPWNGSSSGFFAGSTSGTHIAVNAASGFAGNLFDLQTFGVRKFAGTGDGRLFGTALHNNASAITGATNQYIASGTYTPTLTNNNNISSSTARLTSYTRVGNVVTVGGALTMTITSAATLTSISVSLPIASNFTTTWQGAGAGAVNNGELSVLILSNATNDNMDMTFTTGTTTGVVNISFSFSYEIL